MKNFSYKGFGLMAFGATMIFGSIVPVIAAMSSYSYSYSSSSTGSLGFFIGFFALGMFLTGLMSAVAGVVVVLMKKEE